MLINLTLIVNRIKNDKSRYYFFEKIAWDLDAH